MSNVGEFGPQIKQVKLEKQSELRIEMQATSPLRLRLLDGKAEIFGFELQLQLWLKFTPPLHFAIFTWYGATIEIDGITENEYTSCETPMMSYLNLHNSLQVQRQRFACSASGSVSSQGPRVIIIGDSDSGKTTLAKMLLNWAAKDGWKPTFVDLNIGQSSITIPGTIAATPIKMPVDPIEGFLLDKAIVHYFGHTTPSVNFVQYRLLVEKLARELEEDFAGNAESQASGVVIDTMGWINRAGYELLVHAVRKFNANVVIVLGQEAELVNNLKNLLRFKKNLQVLNMEKSSGVFSRDSTLRKMLRKNKIQNYFYEATRNPTAHTKTVRFSDVQVYQIGDLPNSGSTSAQPRRERPLEITSVKIDEDIRTKVLAISYANQPDQIMSSIVSGFVCITDVNVGEETITYISPSADEFPSKIFILGTLTWHVT